MKKLTMIFGIAVLGMLVSSCNNESKTMSHKEQRENKVVYVEDTINSYEGMQWARDNWSQLDNEYTDLTTQAKQEADKHKDPMDEEVTIRWNNIKTKVSQPVYSTYVVSACGGLGVEKPGLSLAFLTVDNIEPAYAGFVNAVKMDYDKFSKDDARIISSMWDDLNDRKNELEPIPAGDNIKIAAHKTEFAVVKSALKIKTGVEEAL